MIIRNLSKSFCRPRPRYSSSSASSLKKEVATPSTPSDLENDPEALAKIAMLKEKLKQQKALIDANKPKSSESTKKIIEQRLEDYIPPLNVEDDSAEGLFDEEHLDVVNNYLKKAYSDHELFLKDLELNYIDNYKQRTFYKMVRMFKEETGETKRGYIEFTSALLLGRVVFFAPVYRIRPYITQLYN